MIVNFRYDIAIQWLTYYITSEAVCGCIWMANALIRSSVPHKSPTTLTQHTKWTVYIVRFRQTAGASSSSSLNSVHRSFPLSPTNNCYHDVRSVLWRVTRCSTTKPCVTMSNKGLSKVILKMRCWTKKIWSVYIINSLSRQNKTVFTSMESDELNNYRWAETVRKICVYHIQG